MVGNRPSPTLQSAIRSVATHESELSESPARRTRLATDHTHLWRRDLSTPPPLPQDQSPLPQDRSSPLLPPPPQDRSPPLPDSGRQATCPG
jgi:hypothetical protein